MKLEVTDFGELSVIEEGLQLLDAKLRKAHDDYYGPDAHRTPYSLRMQTVGNVRQRIKEAVWGKS